jgi:hypothetical protein
MRKSESLILESATPEEYVERSLKAKLSPAIKAQLARSWMEKTGFTREDILHARNRNPYWKRKKMEGAAERTRRRLDLHDYSNGVVVSWTSDKIAEFIELNRTGADGKYLHKDWELASHFGTSIPSIQYMRRKFHKTRSLLGPRVRKEKMIEYMGCSETVLDNGGPKKRSKINRGL